jgi:hypothetical protein
MPSQASRNEGMYWSMSWQMTVRIYRLNLLQGRMVKCIVFDARHVLTSSPTVSLYCYAMALKVSVSSATAMLIL